MSALNIENKRFNRKEIAMKVNIVHYVEQVQDGSKYRGYVMINRVKLYFELALLVPILLLEKTTSANNAIHKKGRIFQVKLRKNSKQIELNDEEFNFFAHMFFSFADELYNDRRTRAVNGIMDFINTTSSSQNGQKFNLFAAISMAGGGEHKFPSGDRKMLTDKKFGVFK